MKNPQIGIIMGSDSDLSVVKDALVVLNEFNVSYEVHVFSAHRTPEETIQYAKASSKKGIKIIIAAAGGAAHLAGVIAAHVIIPVIGIPIKTPTLNGVDSLYSIVQMPPGVPVATVGINAAKNAGILALEILALNDRALQNKLLGFKKKQRDKVLQKSEALEKIGYQEYLKVDGKK